MPKILVVDDDVAMTRALAIRLRAAGFEVVVAHDADRGSRLAVSERPDVILLDVDMPHYSGLELHECLRFAERVRHVPVVYLSGNDCATNRAVAFQQGARAFLSKPYEPARLIQTLNEVVAGSALRAAPEPAACKESDP
ncbi:MAG: response regulator [Planctomycetes bacterium]|nr:response regulator [Planctomycetota bacterium]